ncbi:TPA: TolC family protein, partial [Legionella pneumophila]|nr:TolC family protein [Legionella pneumophila]
MMKQNWGLKYWVVSIMVLMPVLVYAKPPLGLKELTHLAFQNNKDLKAAR